LVQLCVTKIDLTAPSLADATLVHYLPYGTNTSEVRVLSNEPVELRWSEEDVLFDEMENHLFCSNTGGRTVCIADIPMNSDEATIYVRGRDHPSWAGTDKKDERNTNQESLVIQLKKTNSRLQIDSVIPEDGAVITSGLPTVTVNVEVRTSGGDTETTSCYLGYGRIDAMELESSGVHKKSYDKFGAGSHKLYVECEDGAGNKATKQTSFRIIKDISPTAIARVYDDGGTLVVVTKEDATCGFYNTKGCSFSVANSELMDGAEKIHRTGFDRTKTYYIKCKDAQGNERASQCDMVVTGGML
jgi:hypothetical protein